MQRKWLKHTLNIAISLILIFSCRSTKVEKNEEIERLRQDIVIKIDSLNVSINQIKETKKVVNQIDSSNINFKVDFDKGDIGETTVFTPAGNLLVNKKGNGSVTVTGTVKSLKSDKNEYFEKKNYQKDQSKSENSITEDLSRQITNETTKIEPNKLLVFLGLFPWWFWLLLILLILFIIFRKIIMIYLKSNPITSLFFKNKKQ